jgi:hypothetical protein
MVNLSKEIVKKSMYLGLPGLSLALVLSGVSSAEHRRRRNRKNPARLRLYVGRCGGRRARPDDKAVEKL